MMIRCFVFLAVVAWSTVLAVEVSTGLGSIRGVKLKSRLGEDFFAFRGIRYAKSPVGELRFKNPKPVEPWKPSVFNATDDGPMCPQTYFNSSDYSEDCLRLNVYTKNLDRNAKKPVIIYIHPGGFYSVSGQSKNFAGPQLLMDRDIVLVTINYRLGTAGFLAVGTADAPGNAGLKDQVVAFKWVRDHIENFGGDPNSVTLCGYSAGSFSIGLHLVSPMSKGLFHRGIAMSASPILPIEYPYEQVELAKKQARLVNCKTDNVDAMVRCLRETPVEKFAGSHSQMFVMGWNPVLNWQPVIEKDFGQERFLIEDPLKSYQEGRIQRVPLIIGMTEYEFIQIGYDTIRNKTQVQQLNEDWETLAPICFKYEENTPKSRNISALLRKEYLDDKPLVVGEPFEKLGELYKDAVVRFGVHRWAHLAARYIPVHYYRFSYKGRYSFFVLPGNKTYGAVHHDDLFYILYMPIVGPLFTKSDPEDTTIERMTRMWTQFAKSSDPNNPNDKYLKNLRWAPLDLKEENYLDIGEEMVNRKFPNSDRVWFWEKLFPLDWSACKVKPNSKNLNYPEPL